MKNILIHEVFTEKKSATLFKAWIMSFCQEFKNNLKEL